MTTWLCFCISVAVAACTLLYLALSLPADSVTADKQHRQLSEYSHVWLQVLFECRGMAILLISSSIWMLQLKSYNGNSSARSNTDIQEKAVRTEKVYVYMGQYAEFTGSPWSSKVVPYPGETEEVRKVHTLREYVRVRVKNGRNAQMKGINRNMPLFLTSCGNSGQRTLFFFFKKRKTFSSEFTEK